MDPSVARRPSKVQYVLLPAELQLTRFLGETTGIKQIFDLSAPGCTWHGVRCDESNRIVLVDWVSVRIANLHWEHVPPHLSELHLGFNDLRCVLPTGILPQSLQVLTSSRNEMHGSIDLSALPSALKTLMLRSNAFTGEIMLDSLPPEMTELNLSKNRLFGSIFLNALPSSLAILDLSSNRFSGMLDLCALNNGINALWLYGNQFSCILDLRIPPDSLMEFNVWNKGCEFRPPVSGWKNLNEYWRRP